MTTSTSWPRVTYLATPLRYRWMGVTPTLPVALRRLAKPDVVHVNSVFEGLAGEAVVPDATGLPRSTVLSATAYDLIPLIYAETYLQDDATRGWYRSRLERLCRCDILLAISDATRQCISRALALYGQIAPQTTPSVTHRYAFVLR